jgi:ABC-2 type transport system permease protein
MSVSATDMKTNSAIVRIAANEIRRSWRNRSLPILCLGLAALLLLSSLIAWGNQTRLNAQRAQYQQTVRNNWLEQPDRHPHRASHYGYLALRPKSPLSFFDSGVDSFAGTSVFLEPHRQNPANFSEARHSSGLLRFGELSPAMVLQLLVPLALCCLGFTAITGEREAGTLPILMAQGVGWRGLIAGKTLGVTVMALFVAAPATLLLLGWRVIADGDDNRDSVWRALGLIAAYGLFISIAAVVAVLVSAWQRTSRGALTTLIVLWILFCVVMPRGAQTLGAIVTPAPAKAQFDAALENDLAREGDSHNPNDPHFAALRAQTLNQHQVNDVKDLPFNYGAFVMLDAERVSSAIFRRHYGQLLETFRRQNRFSQWAAVINPYLAIRRLSMALAGSDLAHYTEFQWQAEDFRCEMVQKLNQLHLTEIRFENDRAQRVSHEHWETFPPFEYRPPTIGWALRREWLSAAALVGWSLILIAIVRCIKPRILS